MSLIDTLKALAITVRNEKKKEANSAVRIGDLFIAIIDYIKLLVSGQIRQGAVDTYDDTSGGKTSLLSTYPNPEVGWTVFVREENTDYHWNGSQWIDLERYISQDDIIVSINNIMVIPADVSATKPINAMPLIIKEIALEGGFYNKFIGVSAFLWRDNYTTIQVFVTEYPDRTTPIIPTANEFLCVGNSDVISDSDELVKIPLTDHFGKGISGYIVFDVTKFQKAAANLPTNSQPHSYNDRGIITEKIIDLNGSKINSIDSRVQVIEGYNINSRAIELEKSIKYTNVDSLINSHSVTANINIARHCIKNFVLFGTALDNKYLVLSQLGYSSDLTTFYVRISSLDTIDERPTSSNMKYYFSLNIPPSDRNSVIRFNLFKSLTECIGGYIDVDLAEFGFSTANNLDPADYPNYRERGLNPQYYTEYNHGVFNNTAFLRQANIDNYEFFKNGILSIVHSEPYQIAGRYFSLRYFAFVGTSAAPKVTIQIGSSNNPLANIHDYTAPLYASISNYDLTGLTGKQTIKLDARGVDGKAMYIVIDLDKMPYSPSRSIVTNTAIVWNYYTNGLDSVKMLRNSLDYKTLKSTDSSGGGSVGSYSSALAASKAGQKGVFSVGNMMMKNKVLAPVTWEDYEPTKKTVCYPEKLSIQGKITLSDAFGRLALGWIDNNDIFYLYSTKVLYRTDSLDKPVSEFTQLFTAEQLGIDTFKGVRIADNDNELLIYTWTPEKFSRIFWTDNNQTSIRQITVDGVTSDRMSFADYSGIQLNLTWAYDHYHDIVCIADYDNASPRGNGGWAFLSTDKGRTFNKVLDLSDRSNVEGWEKDANGNYINKSIDRTMNHIHGFCYDKYWNRLWLYTGDGATYKDNTQIFWSDDLGITWKSRRSTVQDDNDIQVQCVSLYPLPECILMGTDTSTINGYMRINRTTKDDEPQYEYADVVYRGGGLYFYDRIASYKNGVLLCVHGKNMSIAENDSRSYVTATKNGFELFRVWVDEENLYHSGLAVFQMNNGRVYLRTQEGAASDENSRVIIDLGILNLE